MKKLQTCAIHVRRACRTPLGDQTYHSTMLLEVLSCSLPPSVVCVGCGWAICHQWAFFPLFSLSSHIRLALIFLVFQFQSLFLWFLIFVLYLFIKILCFFNFPSILIYHILCFPNRSLFFLFLFFPWSFYKSFIGF